MHGDNVYVVVRGKDEKIQREEEETSSRGDIQT